MCGILVSALLSPQNAETQAQYQRVIDDLRRVVADRGPDAQAETTISGPSSASTELKVTFFGSELRLRGDFPVQQPHVDGSNVLCWNGEIFDGIEVSPHENDGQVLFSRLCTLETQEEVQELMGMIEGPYAFTFYHARSERIYFARDPLGRRSLLLHPPSQDEPFFILSSVSSEETLEFVELDTSAIFFLDLHKLQTDLWHDALDQLPRESASGPFVRPERLNSRLPPPDLPIPELLNNTPDYIVQIAEDLRIRLDRSVRLRVRDIPTHGIQNGEARVAVLFSGGIDCAILAYLAALHLPEKEPIDLLNVAFENPRKIKAKKESTGASSLYEPPDRLSGRQETEELRRLFPKRTFNFVEINVPYDECQATKPLVQRLMLPGRTVMDLSLAIALYFAARGCGQVQSSPEAEPIPYTSPARVLLSGLGSDELMGGYSRHRTVYEAGGWEALINELQLEIDRIPTRNLGRDDRVISSHGKETRHPFLSLSIVNFLAKLPVHCKVDPRLPSGVGDKCLLRLLARQVGMTEASSRKKRAMQFGSHSARMDGEKRGDVVIE